MSAISLLGFVGAANTVMASHAPAPTSVTCGIAGTDVNVDWDDMSINGTPITHYGIEFITTYGDEVREFDFSVNNVSEFSTPLTTFDIDTDNDGTPDTNPDTLEVTVKSLNPGKHRQNNAKAGPVSCA
ncbi:MAG: hypothetical protein QXU32_03065 [Nitrososphaerales archaeon]